MGCTPIKKKHDLTHEESNNPIEDEVLRSHITLKYTFIKVLGQGGMGKTYLCKDKEGELYAVQRILKSRLGNEETKELVSNFHLLQSVNNQYIIKFYELFEEINCIYIVMEYCSGVELFDKVLSLKTFNEYETAKLVAMILTALCYLHKSGITHGDVKPQNVMFATNEPNSIVKLIDFNLCKFKTEGTEENPNGTPQYLAPEIIEGKYSTASDIWSVGVIIYIFLSGEFPFWGETHDLLYRQIKEGKPNLEQGVWRNVSENAKNLIKKCFSIDAKKRITAEEALAHPWFKTASKHTKAMSNEVRKNFESLHLLHKLHQALRKLISKEDWEGVLPRVKEMLSSGETDRMSLNVRDLKDLLKEVNLHATMDELQTVLKKFNKGDSDQLNIYHLFAKQPSSNKQIQKLHSCGDISEPISINN